MTDVIWPLPYPPLSGGLLLKPNRWRAIKGIPEEQCQSGEESLERAYAANCGLISGLHALYREPRSMYGAGTMTATAVWQPVVKVTGAANSTKQIGCRNTPRA